MRKWAKKKAVNKTRAALNIALSLVLVGTGFTLVNGQASAAETKSIHSVQFTETTWSASIGAKNTLTETVANATQWFSVIKTCKTVNGSSICTYRSYAVATTPVANAVCMESGLGLASGKTIFKCAPKAGKLIWQKMPVPALAKTCYTGNLITTIGSVSLQCQSRNFSWVWVKYTGLPPVVIPTSTTSSTPTATPSQTSTPTPTPTATPTATATPTPTPTATATPTPTPTATPTATATPTPTPTPSPTFSVSADNPEGTGTLGDVNDYTFLTTAVLSNGSSSFASWDRCLMPIRYKINTTNMPAGALADVQEALRRITAASGYTFRFDGTTTVMPRSSQDWFQPMVQTNSTTGALSSNDADLYIAFSNAAATPALAGAVAAIGGPITYSPSTSRGPKVLFGSLIVDTEAPMLDGFGTGVYRGTIIMHELGHALNLGHASESVEVMYPNVGSTSKSLFQKGDITGFRRLFANPCF